MIQPLDFQDPYLFRNRKSRSFQECQDQHDRGFLKVVALQGSLLQKSCQGYKRPKAPFRPKKETPGLPALCLDEFKAFLLSSKHKKHTKNTSNPLDSSFTKNTRYCSYTQFSFPWFYTLDLGFRGVIHTPNLLNIFLAFILFFLIE